MPILLDGKVAREARMESFRERVCLLPVPPTLVIVQIGALRESNEYIKLKKRFSESVGVHVQHISLPESSGEAEVIAEVGKQGREASCSGIIVQLPLPPHLSRERIINTIPPEKDIDGLTALNQKRLAENDKRAVVPATARGIVELLEFYNISVSEKKVAVLGRSILVGAPIAQLLKNHGAVVTVCHSQTPNTKEITRASDIVIVAIGKPRLIGADYLLAGRGQVVVDVGINAVSGGVQLELEAGRRPLVGDVDFDAVKDMVAAITPVPGGVGPMTILALFENLLDIAELK
ncbi:MAG: methylenetetrahydrofolate dehydrogenase (NADP+) / methenyltetrahydrofolate cyclohydrolase [Parcubacteria group bacterium Gr01-1014_72]|nr:MAG: methylenetetrahydrofolate dehydrogenase (NADP+) / methenyltetrahydrofolate cyclohydrolase [Parcubacteria group bacterium Gr01-1014_72]